MVAVVAVIADGVGPVVMTGGGVSVVNVASPDAVVPPVVVELTW